MLVTLSTGEKVTFKDRFTHRMHKALFSALNKGSVYKVNAETGAYEKEILAENIEFQYEPVFPLIIEKIEKSGKEIPYTPEWLEDLLQIDYVELENAAATVKMGNIIEEGGEKKE